MEGYTELFEKAWKMGGDQDVLVLDELCGAVDLGFVPEELVDYVVVHELAHRKEMNHSNAFWNVVEKYMPDYKERRKKLREYHIE